MRVTRPTDGSSSGHLAAERVIAMLRGQADSYYFGVSIQGFYKGKPVLGVREWFGWPDIDVPLPPKPDTPA